jgi:hypothetical protein
MDVRQRAELIRKAMLMLAPDKRELLVLARYRELPHSEYLLGHCKGLLRTVCCRRTESVGGAS